MAEGVGDAEFAPWSKQTKVLDIGSDEGAEVFLEEALECKAFTPLVIDFLSMEEERSDVRAPFIAHDDCARFVEEGRDDCKERKVSGDRNVTIKSSICIECKEGRRKCAFYGEERESRLLSEFFDERVWTHTEHCAVETRTSQELDCHHGIFSSSYGDEDAVVVLCEG